MAFVPEFDDSFSGYVHNHLKRNFWKVASSMAYDDVMQEARYCFCYLVNRYPDVDNAAWFMSLFKRAWFTHFQDMAYKDSRYRMTVPLAMLPSEDTESLERDPVGELDIDSTSIWLRDLPSEFQEVLMIMLAAPSEILDLVMNSLSKTGTRAKTANAKVCAALGLPESTEILEMVKRLRISV